MPGATYPCVGSEVKHEYVICGIHRATLRQKEPGTQGFRALSLTAYESNWHGVCWQAADIMETSCR